MSDLIKSAKKEQSIGPPKQELWIIELNLDDKYSNSTAYHIDTLSNTIKRHLLFALDSTETDRWVTIGVARSYSEAHDECGNLHKLLCKMGSKKARYLEDILHESHDEQENEETAEACKKR